MQIKSLIRSATLATAVLFGALSANAETVTFNNVFGGGTGVTVGQTNTGSTVNTTAGTMNLTVDGKTFYSYCVELTQFVNGSPQTYALNNGVSYFDSVMPSLPTSGLTIATRLAKLFSVVPVPGNTAPTGGTFNSVAYSATEVGSAIQLAVWESIYEGNSTLTLASNIFKQTATSGAATRVSTLANHFLSLASTATNYSVSHVKILKNSSYQDYIVIPEPATLALAAMALMGMGFAVRRRG